MRTVSARAVSARLGGLLRRLRDILTARDVRPTTKVALIGAALSRRTLRRGLDVPMGGGRVTLSATHLLNDYSILYATVVDQVYGRDLADRIVLDLGGHRGYVGAWALDRGAAAVLSVEPEPTNHALLARAAATFRRRGRVWEVRRCAAGATARTATLGVMTLPYSHSLLDRPDRARVAEIDVAVVPLPELIDAAAALAPGHPLLVKIDVEGAECELVLDTPARPWARVDEVWIEFEGIGACSRAEMEARLEGMGLAAAPSPRPHILHHRRAHD